MPIVSELILSLMLTASLSAGAPLSAPPGLAVSLPAITAQAQQLHTPLMILHAGGVTPEGVTGSNSLEALEHSYEKRLPAAGAGLLLDLRRGAGLRPRLERFLWPHPGHGLPHPGPVRGRPGQHLRLHFPDPGSSDRLAEGTPRRLHRHRHQGGTARRAPP